MQTLSLCTNELKFIVCKRKMDVKKNTIKGMSIRDTRDYIKFNVAFSSLVSVHDGDVLEYSEDLIENSNSDRQRLPKNVEKKNEILLSITTRRDHNINFAEYLYLRRFR